MCHFGNLHGHLAAVGSIDEVNGHNAADGLPLAGPLAEDVGDSRRMFLLVGQMCSSPGPISRCLNNSGLLSSLLQSQKQMHPYTHELLLLPSSMAMSYSSSHTC